MDVEQLITLIDKVSGSELTGFKYEENGIKLQLSKKDSPVLEPALAVQSQAGEVAKTGTITASEKTQDAIETKEAVNSGKVVKAPLVGTFYAAPAEDAPPFIQVGDSVKKGQSIAIIEAMKLMNEIESDYDGIVAEILVENAQPVEYGQPLFRIA